MKKKQLLSGKRNFRPVTAMTVVAHAMVRAKKGKRPSMGYCGILNPRDAYKKATSLICNAREMFHICDLMALFTHKRISPSGMDIFYDGIHFLQGKRPQTSIFTGDLLDQVSDHLASELPFLKEIEVPNMRLQEELLQWSRQLEKKYGAFHEISRMGKEPSWLSSMKKEYVQPTSREIKSGCMPNTDFRYEEFEGLLASFYLTISCLKDREGEDGEVFEQCMSILNGFAERHNVRFPEEAAKEPRATEEEWGQPNAFLSCSMLLDMMHSFWRDFGIGAKPNTQDCIERCRLGWCILGMLHRHDAIAAKFQEYDGKLVAVGVQEDKPMFLWKLEAILPSEEIAS